MKKILFIILFFPPVLTFSQTSFNYEIGSFGLASPNAEIMPHWLIYNRNGLFSEDANEFLIYLDADFSHSFGKKWKVEAGLKGINKYPLSASYFQESFLNLSFGKLKLIMGKEEMSLSAYNEDVSAGSFFVSNNARPFPRIGMGFYEFVDLPFTKGYVQVKGFVNQGILDDNRKPRGTDKPLLHEKSAYIRSNKLKVNPHFGISHSALFGGTMPDGTKIPVDYTATFFAKSSQKVGDIFWGEETNVAGGHFGLFDFGLNFKISDIDVETYLQKPINDRSGFIETFRRNKDFIFGISAKVNNSSYLKAFVYERAYTLWQSGPGIPDPYLNGNYSLNIDFSDLDKVMLEIYGIEVQGISDSDFWKFVRRKENYGYEYGGRDSYYNNGLYFKGFSYHGNALGNSMLLTLDRIMNIDPGFDTSYDLYFANTRISTHHFGFLGNFSKNMDYRLLFTYTNNLGTYAGLNRGHDNWDSMNPDSDYKYFFEVTDFAVDGKNQFYTMLETGYSFDKVPGLKFNINLGIDAGKLYENYGVLVGLRYSGSVKRAESRE